MPQRPALGKVPGTFSGGAYSNWSTRPQADSYPNYKTVHRRFQQWCRSEVLRAVMTDLANTLRDEGALDESECFIDASFASAKGGGQQIGPTKRGKGVKIMAIVDRKQKGTDLFSAHMQSTSSAIFDPESIPHLNRCTFLCWSHSP